MTEQLPAKKPKEVFYAEIALWLWTTWVCLYGFYQYRGGAAKIEADLEHQVQNYPGLQAFPDVSASIIQQSHDYLAANPLSVPLAILAVYGSGAALATWFILKIGQGKAWARSSFFWTFALQLVWIAVSPFNDRSDYLTDLPDVVLQAYAVYYLYTKPGKSWFKS